MVYVNKKRLYVELGVLDGTQLDRAYFSGVANPDGELCSNDELLNIVNGIFLSKDNSELTVKEALITNTSICLAVYQKKQKYRGGIININPHKINCNGIPSYVHKFSKIIFKN